MFKFNILTLACMGGLLGLVALGLLWPDLVTLGIVFIFYLNLPAVAHRFHEVPQLIAGSVMMLLLLPVMIYLLRGDRVIVDRTFILMSMFLVVLLVSALFGEDFYSSLQESVLTYVVEGLMLYLLIINVVRNVKSLRRVVWTLLLAGSLMGGLSLYKEVTKSYNNTFFGLAQTTTSSMATGETDRQGQLIRRSRFSGPIGEKNRYAQILIILIPLALYGLKGEHSPLLRMVAVGASIFILSGAFLSFSQGAAVTLVVVFVLMVCLRQISPRHALVILALVLVAAMTVPDYIERISGIGRLQGLISKSGGVKPSSSMVGRATENLAAINIFLDNPLLGVGPGQYKFLSMEYGNRLNLKKLKTSRRAHNLYLEQLANVGVIGFVSFMAIVLVIMYRLWRLFRKSICSRPDLGHLAACFFFSVVAYLVSATFLHLSYMRYYWFLLAIASAAVQILEREAQKFQDERIKK